MLSSMLPLVTPIREMKSSINDPLEMLQPLQVPEWKWEEIAMNFVVGLPKTLFGYGSLWVTMDRLTKVAHFIPVKTTYTRPQLAELYRSRIVYSHGLSKQIVSTKGTQFILKFWDRLNETLDTHLNFSSAYHAQTDR
jgi:hypothetical protein